MKRSLPILGLVVGLAVVHIAAQGGGSVTGKVFVRERENGDQSLLIEAESPSKVDRVELHPGRRLTFLDTFTLGGWRAEAKGDRIVASGDPLYRVNLRLDTRATQNLIRNLAGKEVELRIGTPGTPEHTRLKIRVGALPPVAFEDFGAVLGPPIVFPRMFTPGRPVLASPSPGYTDGAWVASRQPKAGSPNRSEDHVKDAEALLSERARNAPRDTPRLFDWTKIFEEAAGMTAGGKEPATRPTFTYFDPWGERLAQVQPSMDPVPPAPCTDGITGGTPMAFAGKDACMQGCFKGNLTDLEKAAAILLDDKIPVTPVAASPASVVVHIPNDIMAGTHVLSWPGVPGQLNIRILQVQGTIDQNQLWTGQATTMRLQILGSDQPIPLKIVNRTPATIKVEGGDDQLITTSGGQVNVVTRQVRGVMKGDFSIDYSIDQPACGPK